MFPSNKSLFAEKVSPIYLKNTQPTLDSGCKFSKNLRYSPPTPSCSFCCEIRLKLVFWSSLLNIDIFPRKAAGSVIQPLYYLKQYLHLIYFSRYQWCLVNRYRGTRNINFFDLKIAKNRKVLIVQSVPINMGIKWRFLYCFCFVRHHYVAYHFVPSILTEIFRNLSIFNYIKY